LHKQNNKITLLIIYTDTHKHVLLPSGGLGNFIRGLSIASRKIHVSCALPSKPAQTNVNCMSKLHATITFWVGTPFRPINGIWFSKETHACTCVPSIAPTQF
jgi:hypothetical protein